MFELNLSERDRKLLLVTLVVVVFYLFYLMLFGPKWAEISQLKAQLESAKQSLKIAETKANLYQSLAAATSGQSKVVLSKEQQTIKVLNVISKTAAAANLDLSAIKPLAESGDEVKFNLACIGSYKNLYDFLGLLNEAEMDVYIDSLSVSGGGIVAPVLAIEIYLTANF